MESAVREPSHNYDPLAGFSLGIPQNTVPFDIGGIRSGLQDALKQTDCREFIENLLDAAKTKKNPLAKSGDIMTLFESVVSGQGFTRTAPPGSAGHGNPIGRISDNNAGIFLFGSPKNSAAIVLHFDIEGTLHELLHHAGSKDYYSDATFAKIVNDIPEYAALARTPFPLDGASKKDRKALENDPGSTRWGVYWDDLLRQKCFHGN
ncbi:MAG: hypothetical protein ACRD9S_22290 [Pyrinomonadaceae bacterium]